MGRGIAQSYAVAGVPACLVDLKDRSEGDQKKLRRAVKEEIGKDLAFASDVGLLHTDRIEKILNNIRITRATEKECNLSDANFIFEAVPEIIDAKKAAFEWISQHAAADAIVASTTSTLRPMIPRTSPRRSLSALVEGSTAIDITGLAKVVDP